MHGWEGGKVSNGGCNRNNCSPHGPHDLSPSSVWEKKICWIFLFSQPVKNYSFIALCNNTAVKVVRLTCCSWFNSKSASNLPYPNVNHLLFGNIKFGYKYNDKVAERKNLWDRIGKLKVLFHMCKQNFILKSIENIPLVILSLITMPFSILFLNQYFKWVLFQIVQSYNK